MKKKFNYNILGGLLIIGGGISVIITGDVWSAPAQPETGGLIILFGIIYTCVQIIKRNKKNEEGYLKCLKCGDVVNKTTAKSITCQKCAGVLEDLDGFFERHPELKDAQQSK